ncbi:galactokinase [Altererythrobacter sp. GH1-8]|uniref:galactokinase n=1 Tax=Altererythrobacter sp. GH1-8 TaxID=3349333 RepID=UPI00374DD62C
MLESFSAVVPGRVNLIGEHTDYNGGMVLPAALSVRLEATLIPRADDDITVIAESHAGPAKRTLSDQASGHWSDPCVGALREANALGLLTGGASLNVHSTIPEGAGLSSSAALIVAILKAARAVTDGAQTDIELAIAARRVENSYMGVPCGIMDQMAVALATPGSAMALDTKSIDYKLVSLPSSHQFVVIHSGIKRKLTDGRYAARKLECDRAKKYFGTDDLCLIEPEVLARVESNEPFLRRAMHCATEHRRVLAAIDALQSGDIETLGRMMNESHASMRDVFEISLPQIDALVQSAFELGAIGARLTGGGFGGCIVACIERNSQPGWINRLLESHPDARLIDAIVP